MSRSRYTEKDHERAFKLWRQGKSLREISKSDPHLPSREMLSRWKQPDFKCPYGCRWHGWEDLHNQIVGEALEEMESDMPDLVGQEKERLKFLYSIEREITKIMESGELEPPRTYKDAVELLESIYNQQRLIKGESTEITEMRGSGSREINLQKVAKQLNIGDPQELVEAVEDSIIEGE